jgi:hypothetical protein
MLFDGVKEDHLSCLLDAREMVNFIVILARLHHAHGPQVCISVQCKKTYICATNSKLIIDLLPMLYN